MTLSNSAIDALITPEDLGFFEEEAPNMGNVPIPDDATETGENNMALFNQHDIAGTGKFGQVSQLFGFLIAIITAVVTLLIHFGRHAGH